MASPGKSDKAMTTMALGEEGPDAEGDEGMTTMALGEEHAPAEPGEKAPVLTKKKGEEAVTTLALGEESPAGGSGGGNPFGKF
jgi:hypothetical protein